jgi:hypothetical protein
MNGDVIHHFKATSLSYIVTAIKFRFKLLFLLRETHKAVCAIRDCKRKTLNSTREKKDEIISRNCNPHHKKANTLKNTHKAA